MTTNEQIVVKTEVAFDLSKVAYLVCTGLESGSYGSFAIVGYKKPRKVWTGKGWEKVFRHVNYAVSETGGVVLVERHVEEEDQKKLLLDRVACERGLNVMARLYPRHFADFVNDHYDVITGDVFIQCALLGEIVYG